VDANLK
jgi:Na+-driven multidrug efflux pump